MSTDFTSEAIEKITQSFMHPWFHTPIIGYGYTEEGKQIITKIVYRWKEGCHFCDEQRPKI